MNGKIIVIKEAAIKKRSGIEMNGTKLILYSSLVVYTFNPSGRERFVNSKKLEKTSIGV